MAYELAKRLSRPPKVLVVDDEYTVRLMFDRLTKDIDIEITCVGSPQEGIAMLAEQTWDVVFLDMKFPQAMGGMDLLREVNRQNYDAHVIIMSSSINLQEVMAEANRLGVVSFMLKPVGFSVEFLKNILKRLKLNTSERGEEESEKGGADEGTCTPKAPAF